MHVRDAVAGRFDAVRLPAYRKQLETARYRLTTGTLFDQQTVDVAMKDLARSLPGTIPAVDPTQVVIAATTVGGYAHSTRPDLADLYVTHAPGAEAAWLYVIVIGD